MLILKTVFAVHHINQTRKQAQMENIIIPIAAFFAALLTFFSGFGLGTILTPIFMIFFVPELAIALTGIVHLLNNCFKLFLVGRHADKDIVLSFGITAIIGAFAGSWLLMNINNQQPLFTYQLFEKMIAVYPVKFIISVLLAIFSCIDLLPYFRNLQFKRNKLPLGGFLSGFFGGLSGNQGALRAAFLIKSGLSSTAFIGTTVIISTMVDIIRLSIYGNGLQLSAHISQNKWLLLYTIIAGTAGSYVGNILFKKITIRILQIIVAIMLILLSIALGSGII
jgi:uncharacterized membrane protein YfcA